MYQLGRLTMLTLTPNGLTLPVSTAASSLVAIRAAVVARLTVLHADVSRTLGADAVTQLGHVTVAAWRAAHLTRRQQLEANKQHNC